jgi:hypothetical protein
MKLNKNLFIIILLSVVNIFLLYLLNSRSNNWETNIKNCQNALFETRLKENDFFDKILSYNSSQNQLFKMNGKLTNVNNEIHYFKDLIGNYHIVIYFPKNVCIDCIKSMFEQLKKNQKLNSNKVLIISDFYSAGELKIFVENLKLDEFHVCYPLKHNQFDFIKDPIIFTTKGNTIVFVYDLFHKDLFNSYLNSYL